MLKNLAHRLQAKMTASTQRMLGPEFSAKKIAITRTENEYGVDPFGFSLDYALAAAAPLIWMYKNYHRVQTHNIDRVPAGRVLLIANHSGQLPVDAAMVGISMLLEARPPRAVRSMMEKWVQTLPYISPFMARLGQVVGTQENCRRLLENDEAVLVFPEGVKAITKLYRQRYQLLDFGLGFMRLALETGTPIVPIGIIGAEEQSMALYNVKPLAKLLHLPAFNLTPTVLPIPLPTKYHLYFGEPMRFEGNPKDDDEELEKKVTCVRNTILDLISRGLSERTSVF